MTTANIETKNGTKIQIEGDAEDIKKIIVAIQDSSVKEIPSPSRQIIRSKKRESGPSAMKRVENLKEGKFFSQPRSLSEIVEELKKEGHIYPITHISGPMLRLVRKNSLRRIKQDNGWKYINP